jgi:preprotein translocase subunit YajC
MIEAQPLFAAAGAPPPGGSSLVSLLPFLFIFGAMYFFMIAPQRKKQKEHDKMIAALESGDDIVTNGGIFGTITNVKDDRFVVKIAENTKIEVAKGFIQSAVRKNATENK